MAVSGVLWYARDRENAAYPDRITDLEGLIGVMVCEVYEKAAAIVRKWIWRKNGDV